jgi:hypothetical protein
MLARYFILNKILNIISSTYLDLEKRIKTQDIINNLTIRLQNYLKRIEFLIEKTTNIISQYKLAYPKKLQEYKTAYSKYLTSRSSLLIMNNYAKDLVTKMNYIKERLLASKTNELKMKLLNSVNSEISNNLE